MKTATIGKIKELLADGSLSEAEFQALEQDPRAGVQALLQRELRARKAQDKAVSRVEEMLESERRLWARGVQLIAGVDEVGVGPLAGPVLAAAVILPVNARILGVDDSKKLSHSKRESLAIQIREQAIAFAFGHCEPEEIDHHNIYQASRLAMFKAVSNLRKKPQHLLVDARTVPKTTIGQTNLINGDARSHSIAAASILAKVQRDMLMEKYAIRYPGYGFEKHRGYGTVAHIDALESLGPTPIHRKSFAPVAHAAMLQRKRKN